MAEIISTADIKALLAKTDNKVLDSELLSKKYNIKINNREAEENYKVDLVNILTKYFINYLTSEEIEENGTDLIIAGKILKVKLVNVVVLTFIDEVINKNNASHKDQIFTLKEPCLLDIDFERGLSFIINLTDTKKIENISLTIKIKNLENMNIDPKDKEFNDPWNIDLDKLLISLLVDADKTPFNTTIKLSEFNKNWLIETLNILLLTTMDIF